MPSTSPGSSPGRLSRARAALRRVTLVQWVLVTMLGVGGLAFLRAFAGGEGVAVQRLAWGNLAWTFPLLWDVTAVIGSTLWIAALRRTAAFRWGVVLNLVATNVSGLATGSQAYTLARDTLADGWPVPAFIAGYAVPVLYSILTWAAESARLALTRTQEATPWTDDEAGPTTRTAPPTTPVEPAPAPRPLSSPSPSPLPAPATSRSEAPAPSPAASTPTPTPPLPSLSSGNGRALLRPSGTTASPTAPTVALSPSGPGTTPPASSGPSAEATDPAWPGPLTVPTASPATSPGAADAPAPASPQSGEQTPPEATSSPAATPASPSSSGPTPSAAEGSSPGTAPATPSTPDERRAWAVAELTRRAEAPNADDLRPRDIDREFGTKDGWRILAAAQRQIAEGAAPVPATSGAET